MSFVARGCWCRWWYVVPRRAREGQRGTFVGFVEGGSMGDDRLEGLGFGDVWGE